MTTRPIINQVQSLAYSSVQIGVTVRGPHMMAAANVANIVALARPRRGFHLANLITGTFHASYRRTHDAIKQALIQWSSRTTMPSGTTLGATDSLAVDLTITDALGNSVASSSAMIPAGFKGETVVLPQNTAHPALPAFGAAGWLDLDALAATLTDPSWTFEFVITRPTGTVLCVDSLVMREVSRTVVDTSDTYGVDPADFQPGQPMGAGSSTTVGTLRLAKTIEGAIASTDDVLVVGWEDDITATIPKTTAAAYAALTNLEQTAGNAVRWRVPVRPMLVTAPPGDATGETARFRVRYYVAGGGTADVRLVTGSSGSPYAVTGLTGAAWAWSAWTDCRLPTDATDQIATLKLEAQTSAGTVYISGIHVQQT